MEKEIKKEVKEVEVKSNFINLRDLDGKDVKKLKRIPVRLNRRVFTNGLNATMQLVLNPTNLLIGMVSYETVNGQSRRLKFYKPDRLINLLFALDLSQTDERGMDVNNWVFNAPIRFVTGTTKSGEVYHQIEVIFKQYHYESVFLTADQLNILKSLEARGELRDYRNEPYKIDWIVRPELVDDINEDIFDF